MRGEDSGDRDRRTTPDLERIALPEAEEGVSHVADSEKGLRSDNGRHAEAGRWVDDVDRPIWACLAEIVIAVGPSLQLEHTEEYCDDYDRGGETDERTLRRVRVVPGDGDAGDRPSEQKVVDAIRSEGFEGPTWHALKEELASYSMSVLIPWIRSAVIFQHCRERGLHLGRAPFPITREDAEQLAGMTTARALLAFQRRALRAGKWRSDGGASLASWFIGCCIFEFANEWKSWLAEQRRNTDTAVGLNIDHWRHSPGPEDQVVGEMTVLELCGLLDQTTAAILILDVDGYSREDIAAILGLPSAGAVGAYLYRLRKKLKELGSDTLYFRLRQLGEEREKRTRNRGRR